MSDLLVIIPTRGRRAQLDRFLAAAEATREAATDLLIVIDDDDAGTYEGLALPDQAAMVARPREWLGPKLNRHAVAGAARYPVVGFLADDTVPETPGWDAILLGKLETPGIAYPHDHRRSDVPEHPFVSSQIIRALGWLFEPSLRHFYADNILADIGNAAGCLRHASRASVRHLHYTRTRAHPDRTYTDAEVNGPADRAAYQAWRRDRMAADVETVRAVIREGAVP